MIRPVLIALLIVAAAPAQSTRSAGTLDIVIRHGTSLPSATKIMTWEEAIRKSTSLPAATIGMTDRGLIAVGLAADVMVFDPLTVIDHATYENPAVLSDGVRAVIVNGEVALADAATVIVMSGDVVLWKGTMPSTGVSIR